MDKEKIIETLKANKVKILAVVGVVAIAFGVDEDTWTKISELVIELVSEE